ncbi:MAG: GNAT family N-acetyltransferase [Burkholderiaceae bacterium]|nr:GNAT family N-acetyltransferase [Burkholderiaceae bacterium]
MSIVYRPAIADKLPRAEELVVGTINDLTSRHAFGTIAASRPADFQAFCLRDDARAAWIAEDDGRIVGFALGWISARLWFLAELFVAPGQQGRGIGDELLTRALHHATDAGATERGLITFAFNLVSQGLYMRHGFYPRVPLHVCSIERESLKNRPPGDPLRTTPIRPTAADLEMLARLDMSALGISREKHHRYLADDASMKGVLLHDEGECVGYAYISATGHIGPLAVARTRAMAKAFDTALDLAWSSGAPRISAFLPGTSDALAIAMGHRMRLTLPMVLMSSREFGDWTRYLPRNPGFM